MLSRTVGKYSRKLLHTPAQRRFSPRNRRKMMQEYLLHTHAIRDKCLKSPRNRAKLT